MSRTLAPVLLVVALLASPLAAEANVEFVSGPTTGALGAHATIEVNEGDLFVPVAQMRAFNELTENMHDPDDVGAIVHHVEADESGNVAGPSWTAFFSFESSGYVKDDEKADLDADEMLEAFQSNDDPANEARRGAKLPAMKTVGWTRKPYYDEKTHNLTWGLKLDVEGSGEVVNHNIRLLGRHGVMSVILVSAPDAVDEAVAEFEPVLATFSYNDGKRYDQFAPGDKVAALGLTGLVLGGGLLAAAKGGLLAKLGKLAKPIIIGVIAIFAVFGKVLRRIFGGRTQSA